MDLDKLIIGIKTLGFPVIVAVWFMWKIQAFLDVMVTNQATTIELLRQLVEMHR